MKPWAVASVAVMVLGWVGCRGREAALGPAESYRLFVPAAGAKQAVPGGPPLVRALALDEEPALTLGRALNDGFGGEMIRIVHLAKQLVRWGGKTEGRYTEAAQKAAHEPVCLVAGLDSAGTSRGLAFPGWLGGVDARADLRWVGLSANIEGDRALVQTLTGRLATHAADWIARGAVPGPTPPLVDAYRMAMEVIAREWRQSSTGSPGALAGTAGTLEQRGLLAAVRENQAVMQAQAEGQNGTPAIKSAAALLADPRVAATVLYRLAQTRSLAHSAGPAAIYAPFVPANLPAGVNPAQVLGPMRNFQAKLFSAWAHAIGEGRAPADIVDLVQAYGGLFPDERAEVVRIFVVTTFGGTVVTGGASPAPGDATATLATLTGWANDVVAGRRGMRDALETPPTSPKASPPR